jgi:hypothetical protein
MKKLFISHASEDKDAFVRPLAEALVSEFNVWYDEYELVVGASLLEEISKGLATCDYGVVVLSRSFFLKKWPQNELNGLFSLEHKDKKVILPVWHGVTREDVNQYSPILADRLAAKSEDGISAVVKELSRSVAYFDRGKSVQTAKPGLAKLRSSLQRKAEADRSQQIVSSDAGVGIAAETARSTLNALASHVKSLQEEGLIGLSADGPKGNNVQMFVNVRLGRLWLHAEYRNNVVNSARDARLDIALIDAELDPWGHIQGRTEIDREQYALWIAQNDECFWQAQSGDQLLLSEDLVNHWLGKLSDEVDGETS